MNILPDNYELDRYGLHMRLVNEDDAAFIVCLRTNPSLSKYLHKTDSDVSTQIAWIKEYKKREMRGDDYYFIFFAEGKPVGLIRIYGIDYEKKIATAGSWICAPDLPMQIPICILIICREIMFEVLEMEKDCFEVRRGNKKVSRVHEMMGAEVVSEDEEQYNYVLTKVDFQTKKVDIINLLNL